MCHSQKERGREMLENLFRLRGRRKTRRGENGGGGGSVSFFFFFFLLSNSKTCPKKLLLLLFFASLPTYHNSRCNLIFVQSVFSSVSMQNEVECSLSHVLIPSAVEKLLLWRRRLSLFLSTILEDKRGLWEGGEGRGKTLRCLCR